MSARALLFDLGGVVCRFLPERRLAALAGLSGLESEQIRARLWDSGLDADFDGGKFTAASMVRAVCERLGIDAPYAAIEQAWTAAFEPDPDVLAIVAAGRQRHRTALLTDNGPLLRDAMPRLFPEISRLLDPLLFSCDLRARKPSPAIFLRALDRLGVAPGDVILIDDSPAAVDSARAAGLQVVLFTSAPELRTQLGI